MITIKTTKNRLCFKKGPLQNVIDIPERIVVTPKIGLHTATIDLQFQVTVQPYVGAVDAVPEIRNEEKNEDGTVGLLFGQIIQHYKPAQLEIKQIFGTKELISFDIPISDPLSYGVKEATKDAINMLVSSAEEGFEIECTSTI